MSDLERLKAKRDAQEAGSPRWAELNAAVLYATPVAERNRKRRGRPPKQPEPVVEPEEEEVNVSDQ